MKTGFAASTLVLALLAAPAGAVARERTPAESTAMVSQQGDDNTAVVRQFGRANAVDLVQAGDQNRACVTQVGAGLTLNLAQSGGASTSLMQTRGNTHRIPMHACLSMHGGRRPVR